jgi:hypothetical protein
MSLQTWKEEFYPIPANETSPEESLKHSLKKWKGLTKENLQKHGLETNGQIIRGDDGTMPIDSSTCSLCVHFSKHGCNECPLSIAREKPCDSGLDSPYMQFYKGKNPLPMINLLKKCINKNERSVLSPCRNVP